MAGYADDPSAPLKNGDGVFGLLLDQVGAEREYPPQADSSFFSILARCDQVPVEGDCDEGCCCSAHRSDLQ